MKTIENNYRIIECKYVDCRGDQCSKFYIEVIYKLFWLFPIWVKLKDYWGCVYETDNFKEIDELLKKIIKDKKIQIIGYEKK